MAIGDVSVCSCLGASGGPWSFAGSAGFLGVRGSGEKFDFGGVRRGSHVRHRRSSGYLFRPGQGPLGLHQHELSVGVVNCRFFASMGFSPLERAAAGASASSRRHSGRSSCSNRVLAARGVELCHFGAGSMVSSELKRPEMAFLLSGAAERAQRRLCLAN